MSSVCSILAPRCPCLNKKRAEAIKVRTQPREFNMSQHATRSGWYPDGSRPAKDAQDDDFGKRESYEAELSENLKRHKMPKAFLTVKVINPTDRGQDAPIGGSCRPAAPPHSFQE
jgi:hypothetical protein